MTTGPTKSRLLSAPMTALDLERDSKQRDLKQRDLDPPNSELMGPASEQVLAPEPAWVQRAWTRQAWAQQAQQPWAQQAWAQQAWVRRPWARQPWRQEPPSFLQGPFWRWLSWLIFSAPPPSTFWRTSSPTSWLFSPISSKISSRIFSSLS